MKYLLLVLACLVLPAQTQDPARDPLDKAYQALREKKYLDAIDQFQLAVKAAPDRAAIRKDLGYAYLKAGETEWAREMFEQAFALDPQDHRVALELAFLCHETGRESRALELFERVQRFGDAESRKAAAEALGRVDAGLHAVIERWGAAVGQDPSNRAARLELALNLEKHREPARAAEQYLAAWRLPPRRDETLLGLARARHDAGDAEGANGAWLLASRSADTRIAERARAKLPRRDPFANEYRRALDLDPSHTGLRRDLAFLWLAVGRPDEAVKELELVVGQDPHDMAAAAQLGFLYLARRDRARAVPLLERVAGGPDPELARRARQALGKRDTSSHNSSHKILGEKSLALSYLRDALREFQLAHEIDPDDAEVALKLGVVHNLLHDDREAVRWFRLAMLSTDPALASEARRSYNNLAPQFQRVQSSFWMLPLYSSRYRDAFHYAQLKTELRLGRFPLRPYLSLRLVGDWRRKTTGPLPQFLSESSLIGAVGMRTPVFRGLTLWAEAGEAASYLKQRPPGTPRLGPDYRGGVAWFRNLGASLGGESPGAFAEFNMDGVFLSRFQNNFITYWQARPGYRLPQLGIWRTQLFWN
ncbi:MAG: tetratricopeptide repeat protein, partial [Acidobacteria bacterium]|nr:tetratricopeptide repeat protein [Acidobacteriota bacterium]